MVYGTVMALLIPGINGENLNIEKKKALPAELPQCQ